jgi:hypothetical protein
MKTEKFTKAKNEYTVRKDVNNFLIIKKNDRQNQKQDMQKSAKKPDCKIVFLIGNDGFTQCSGGFIYAEQL